MSKLHVLAMEQVEVRFAISRNICPSWIFFSVGTKCENNVPVLPSYEITSCTQQTLRPDTPSDKRLR